MLMELRSNSDEEYDCELLGRNGQTELHFKRVDDAGGEDQVHDQICEDLPGVVGKNFSALYDYTADRAQEHETFKIQQFSE